jgi:hypothetical protein
MSSIGHLPIHDHDAAVAGLGCWGRLPEGKRGVLTHWALAFQPNHPLIKTTFKIVKENLQHPNNSNVQGDKAKRAAESLTMRLTGPVPYQRALHQLLHKAQCQLVDDSFCPAIRDPHSHCNFTAFHAIFGNIVITDINLKNTITPKLLDNHNERLREYNYDAVGELPLDRAQSNFSLEEGLDARKAERMRRWEEKIKNLSPKYL